MFASVSFSARPGFTEDLESLEVVILHSFQVASRADSSLEVGHPLLADDLASNEDGLTGRVTADSLGAHPADGFAGPYTLPDGVHGCLPGEERLAGQRWGNEHFSRRLSPP